MDNFDLKKYLAEGKLSESLNENTEALSREEVIDMAQKIADEFSYEDAQEGGSSMVYMVGDVDGMRFELDTKATNRTPADDAKYGTGEGMGGNFRIDVKPNGYEIRNSEKGGLVAIMDMEDGFRMLSAEESRAEMGLEEGEEDVIDENAFIAMMGANSVKDKDQPKEKDEKDYSNESIEAIDEFDDKSMKAYGDAVKKAYGVKDKKDSLASLLDKYDLDMGWYKKHLIGVDELTPEEEADLEYVEDRIKAHLSNEGKLNEGTWSLGSVNDIKAAIQTMEMGLDMDDTELEKHLQDNDAYFYNVLGDDDLHDYLGRSYDLSAMGQEDRAHNELSDAIGRAYDLLQIQMEKEQGSPKPYSTDQIFKEEIKETNTNIMKLSELKAVIRENILSTLSEETVDVSALENEISLEEFHSVSEADDEEETEEVSVEDEVSVEPEMDEDGGLSQDEEQIQDSLKLAYDNAVAIGDEKLADQIGNTITMFTRTHVVNK